MYVCVVNVNGFVVFSGKEEKKGFIFGEKTVINAILFKRIDSILKIFENVYSLKRINETLMYD